MLIYGIAAHGGAGSGPELADGCKAACEAAFVLLDKGENALDAVCEAVRLLEDDGRYNAGRGSVLRLDGKTVQMDAAVADSTGRLGTVINVQDVKNPVLLARAVSEGPHIALAGRGAENFARTRGLWQKHEVSEAVLKKHARVLKLLKEKNFSGMNPRWREADVEALWNFDSPFTFSCDTVGAVAMDRAGVLAAAASTGGASPMLLGRVGDTPMPGCGFHAGPACAVTATGIGEEIIRRMLSRHIYELVRLGWGLEEACAEGVKSFPPELPMGALAISKEGYAAVSNRPMAHFALVKES